MKWTQQQAILRGEIETSDRLADMDRMACPTCDASFDSVAIDLEQLTTADSDDLEALATYAQDLNARGGQLQIYTHRPALRRFLLASPMSDFVVTDDDERGQGNPFTCPHR